MAYEPLHRRAHTVLGVCEAIGEDFGFRPEWLRILFGVGVFFAPMTTFIAYLALGMFVLASRRLFPAVQPLPVADQSMVGDEVVEAERALLLAA